MSNSLWYNEQMGGMASFSVTVITYFRLFWGTNQQKKMSDLTKHVMTCLSKLWTCGEKVDGGCMYRLEFKEAQGG